MSRRSVTAALLSAAALTGCGTGLEAQLYHPRTPADSTSSSVGDIEVRGLAVEPLQDGQSFDVGGQAVLTGVFVNKGDEDDELGDASSPAATSVVLDSDDPDGVVPVPAGGRSAGDWALVLDDLTQALRPGQYVEVTLDFDKAGRKTFSVPVRTGDNGLADREPEQDPYGE